MKRFLLFAMLWLSVSQLDAQQYYMPQGTTNNIYPFGSNTYNKVQWLYAPSDFVVAPPAGTITKIYFKTWNGASTYSATYGNFSISMTNTTLTSFSNTTFITPTTVVFSGNPVVVPTTGPFTWFSFTLQTPFAYTGQNLILEIQQNSLTGVVAVNCTQPSNNRRIYGTYGSSTGIFADMTMGDIGFDILTSCDSVINFQHNNLTRHSVDISWDPRPGATAYEYVVDQIKANPPSTGYATVTSPSLSLANLPDGTCYYVHIRTNCGPGLTSSWSLDSFCTIADCKTPDVTIDNVTSTTAVASWNAVPGVLSYEYSVGTTPDTPTKGVNTSYTSVKLLGLTPNKPLYFYLKAKCTPTPQSPWGITPFHTMAGTSVDNVNLAPVSIYAYPNPVKDWLTVEIKGTLGKNPVLRLTDVTGREIARQPAASFKNRLDISGLSPGLYYLEYADDVFKQVIKINKQ